MSRRRFGTRSGCRVGAVPGDGGHQDGDGALALGTVVAHEALHRLGRPLPPLVTFGSPPGLRSIIRERLRPQPLRTPGGLGRWSNVADRDDHTVSALRLRTLFPDTGDVLERAHLVKNANSNPHTAVEYLERRETVAPLAQMLRPPPVRRVPPARSLGAGGTGAGQRGVRTPRAGGSRSARGTGRSRCPRTR
ncbi:hypothetical protein ACFVH0_35255 [Streptomyces sp. NPDC127117]|uniref:hypothetical protein n=1 Tax=Streptomyces sp. NPDC127117 TaxID=3345368 RepID=UPI003641E1F9